MARGRRAAVEAVVTCVGPRGAYLIDRAVESRRGRSVVGRTLRWDLEWDLGPGSHARSHLAKKSGVGVAREYGV